MAPTLRFIPTFTGAALALATALALLGIAGCSRAASKPATSISAADREVLAQYEALRAALATDNVGKAHTAGERLFKALEAPGVSAEFLKANLAARALAESYRIEVLRAAFKDFSHAVVPVCRGVDGYYIMATDLIPDGVWVQTGQVVDNPYLGRSMSLYGEVQR